MSDLLKKIQNDRTEGPLIGIMRRLPGFKGYEDMQERRAADTLLRSHIVALLKGQLTALVAAEKTVLNNGGLAHMSKMKDAKSKFQVYIDRIGTAMPGYAGFYDAIKVGPQQLQQIYNFDADMLDYVDKFKAAITAVQTAATSNDGLDKAVADFEALSVEANAAFDKRASILTSLG
jgi:hypothetical protein